VKSGSAVALKKRVYDNMNMKIEDETVKIKEEVGRGTRGGPYVYVVEGNELIHINEYASRKLPGKYEDEVIYEVPKNKLVGKIIYCFEFSRSGGEFLIKCKIDDFEDGRPKRYEYYESLRKRIHDIHHLKFRVRDPALISLLTQFDQLFIPIIRDIKEYENIQNFKISFMGHQARLENAFRNPKLYYFTFMSLPRDKSRINSLKVTRRWLYQLWVLKLLCEALKVSKFKGHEYEGEPYWWIEQGSDFSTGVGETPFGDITFWLEYQPEDFWSEYRSDKWRYRSQGIYTGKVGLNRPDIVVVKGYFERTTDFIDSKKPIDLIIECKEDPFSKWENEINSQILPYQKTFRPRNFLVVSLESVPQRIKKNLETHEIKVIDNLKPSSDNLKTLYNIVEKVFE